MEMQSKKLAGRKPSESTQKYLDIAEVREDTIVMKDGSLRATLLVSASNFALKSEDEQGAITSSYMSFLNSLDFPVQILVQSRVLDINGYLEKLRIMESAQSNELLRIQMNEYIEFVGKLVEFANIMKKNFYVVVPYSLGFKTQSTGLFGKIKGLINPTASITKSAQSFKSGLSKLEERVLRVESGLSGVGLRSLRLKTEELVELMYESYNLEGASPLYPGSLEGLEIEGGDPNLQMPSELSQ